MLFAGFRLSVNVHRHCVGLDFDSSVQRTVSVRLRSVGVTVKATGEGMFVTLTQPSFVLLTPLQMSEIVSETV